MDLEALKSDVQRQIETRQRFEQMQSEVSERIGQLQARQQATPTERAVADVGAGFNKRLADLLGLPLDLAGRALEAGYQAVHGEPKAGGYRAGQAQEAVRGAFQKLGINVDARGNFAGRLGENGADSVAMLAGMFGGADKMVKFGEAGGGTLRKIIGDLGRFAKEHPDRVIVQDVGAIFGATAGEEVAGPVGSFVGGMAGSTGVDMAKGVTDAIGRIMRRAPKDSILSSTADPMAAKAFATQQIEGDILDVENAMRASIRNLPNSDPQTLAKAFALGVRRANKQARAVEGTYWAKVPQADRVDASQIRTTAVNIYKEGVTGNPKTIPQEIIDDIEKFTVRPRNVIDVAAASKNLTPEQIQLLQMREIAAQIVNKYPNGKIPDTEWRQGMSAGGRPLRKGETYKKRFDDFAANLAKQGEPPKGADWRVALGLKAPPQWTPEIPVRKLLAWRSWAQGEIRKLVSEGPSAGKAGLIRNYERLIVSTEQAIEDGLPSAMPAIKRARAFSKYYNDTFTRGPVGEFRRAVGSRRALESETEIALRFLGQSGSIDSLAEASRFAPGDTLINEYKEFIQSSIRQQLDNAASAVGGSMDDAARQAQRFYNQEGNRRAIDQLAQTGGEIRKVADDLVAAVARRKEIEKSALARYAEVQDPDVAIRGIFYSQDPRRTAEELMQTFSKDPNALEGFQSSIIRHIISRAGPSGSNFNRIINEPPIKRMLSVTLEPDKYRRLLKIAKAAEASDEAGIGAGRAIGSVISRFFGAQAGGHVSRLMGGVASIQAPAIFSSAARSVFEKSFSVVPIDEIIVRAVHSGNWEKILLAKAPTMDKDLKRMGRRLRKALGALESVKASTRGARDEEEEQ